MAIFPYLFVALKINPRHIIHMPVVKFIERLDLEQNCSFLNKHQLNFTQGNWISLCKRWCWL